jgi:hypothetical protein
MALITDQDYAQGAKPTRFCLKALSGTLVAFRPHCYPGPAAAPTPGIGGQAITSLAGAVPFDNPVSGITRLTRLAGMSTQTGLLVIGDLLAINSGIDITLNTEQVFTGWPTLPARDQDGLSVGNGVSMGVLVSGATGAGTPTLSMKYTNPAGTTGKIGTNLQATVASSIAGTLHEIGNAAGDNGVSKLESLTLSATWTSGTIHAMLYRKIATLPLIAGTPNAIDLLTGALTQLYNNSCLFAYFIPSTTTSNFLSFDVSWAQG